MYSAVGFRARRRYNLGFEGQVLGLGVQGFMASGLGFRDQG
jgi:hypothetical protein